MQSKGGKQYQQAVPVALSSERSDNYHSETVETPEYSTIFVRGSRLGNLRTFLKLVLGVTSFAILCVTLALVVNDAQRSSNLSATSAILPLGSKQKLDCSIVIVGGGISGLWSLNELARNGYSDSVCLFERETRAGGRVFDVSFASYGGDIEPAGMGAWRIAPNHDATWAVVNRFNISTRPWQTFTSTVEARGVYVNAGDEIGLKCRAYPTLCRGPMQNWTWNDYIQPLLDPAVWTGYTDMRSLITATYGSEVHSFLEDTSSYYAVSVTDMSPFALYDLFQQVELRGDRRPIDGMSQLTNSLLADSISKISGSLVTAITTQPTYQSILPEPAFKAAAVFPNAFWSPEQAPVSYAVTASACIGITLPYLGLGANGEAALHAAYICNDCTQRLWNEKMQTATKAQLDASLMAALKVAFPSKTIPQPLETHYQYWAEGAWHIQQPTTTISQGDVFAWSRTPITSSANEVFLIGEAYSDYRQWCQGALTSAQRAMQDGFGIQPPRSHSQAFKAATAPTRADKSSKPQPHRRARFGLP